MNIFISRNIDQDSPIRAVIGDNNIVGQALISFSSIPFDPPECDWIFFYSKNGVKYFFEQPGMAIRSYNWACMSKGTAEELAQYVMDISFIGSGNPMKVAAKFSDSLAVNERVCFVRAKNSLDSIKKLIDDERHFSIPVYDNQPINEIPNDPFDVLIFTSPLNVKTYFNYRPYEGQKVIVIGETTANKMHSFGFDVEVMIAEEPSEKGIAHKLAEIL